MRYIGRSINTSHTICKEDLGEIQDCLKQVWQMVRDEMHYIRAVVLEEMVFMHIHYVVHFIRLYEDSFRAMLDSTRTKEIQQQLSAKLRKATQAKKRNEKLNLLFQRVYEEHVAGKQTKERFLQLSNGYDSEKRELKELVANLAKEISQQEQQTTQVEEFISKCKRYSELNELTPAILRDLVSKVFIEVPDKSTGKRRQSIHVSYTLLGILPPLERFKPIVVECSDKEKSETV